MIQFATTPFKGQSRSKTFQNVLELPVGFPDNPKVTSYVYQSLSSILPHMANTNVNERQSVQGHCEPAAGQERGSAARQWQRCQPGEATQMVC